MTYLAIDVETSGLQNFKLPADHPSQPYIASISMIFLDDDLNEERQFNALIKPEGWSMSAAVTAINGLTTERLLAEGIPIGKAMDVYVAAIKEGRIVVAFNSQFDLKCVRGALRRLGRDDLFEQTPNICTMRELVGVCKIEKMTPGGGYKFPKLIEAAAHFKIPHADLHGAVEDNRINAELLRKLKWLKLMPEPKVHFAKNRPLPPAPIIPLKEALAASAAFEKDVRAVTGLDQDDF